MKKPDEATTQQFSEFMWMADEDAEGQLEQQIEEEMQLIEQDFLEAMFDQLLAEEEEKESYYGPPDGMPNQNASNKSGFSMQLPQVRTGLNPNAPVFVPKYMATATAS